MRRAVATLVLLVVIAGACGDDDDVAESDETTTTLFQPELNQPTSTNPDGTLIVDGGWYEVDADTTYSTTPQKLPVLRFTPPASGWAAGDSIACPTEALGTLRLSDGRGFMYVVPTATVTVDDAIEALLEGPLVDPVVADTTIAGWTGRSVTATLDGTVRPDMLGSYRGSEETAVLPYHTFLEDFLPATLDPDDEVDIHVVQVDEGVLSIVLATDPGVMDSFRSEALVLADTLEIVATGEVTGEDC